MSAALDAADLAQVQTLALTGYPKLPLACYLLLTFGPRARPHEWLDAIRKHITVGDPGESGPGTSAEHVAFTHRGLEALKLEAEARTEFGVAFCEGMGGSGHRAWDLGDVDEYAPHKWTWGGPDHPVDALVLLYAADEQTRDAMLDRHRQLAVAHGLDILDSPFNAGWPPAPGGEGARERFGTREHFGFVDGLSQPKFRLRAKDRDDAVAPGELLLGHPSERGAAAPGASVGASPAAREAGLQPVAGGRYDFGRNGTFLVYRQLEQDVRAFWSFASGHATAMGSLERCAAKLVGRWRNGAPLTLAHDEPADMNAAYRAGDEDVEFEFDEHDADGNHCPLGAHIRRANPRDTLPGFRPRRSLAATRRHRLLRRGRPYGPPAPGWPDPTAMLAATDDTGKRGLHFICLNADLEEQFEFVQQRWLNDPTFVNARADEVDPMIGRQRADGSFVVPPSSALRAGDGPIPRFVTMRGGEYFFLPSAAALTYLVRCGSS